MNYTVIQKKIAEQLLLTVINRESYVEYAELTERVEMPIKFNQIGREAYEVARVCHKLGLPLLSAKAIRAGGRSASANFYNILDELGYDTKNKDRSELFKQELQKIRECKEWYKLAEYYGLKMDLPLPAEKPVEKPRKVAKWLVSCGSDFDILRAYKHLEEMDFQQSASFNIGDIVYIYCRKPHQKVMFQTVVKEIAIPFSKTINDGQFWKDRFRTEKNIYANFVRLKFEKYADTNDLSFSNLTKFGLKRPPGDSLRLHETLAEHIGNEFEKVALIKRH